MKLLQGCSQHEPPDMLFPAASTPSAQFWSCSLLIPTVQISNGYYMTVISTATAAAVSLCDPCCSLYQSKAVARSKWPCVLQLVLIIDSREQYSHVAHSKADGLARHVQLVRDHGIPVEVRGLQQGDALWIAKSRWAIIAPHLRPLFWLPSCGYLRAVNSLYLSLW